MTSTLRIETTDQNGTSLGEKVCVVEGNHEGIYYVEYEGIEFWSTGKTGLSKGAKDMVELSNDNDERLWIATDESLIILD